MPKNLAYASIACQALMNIGACSASRARVTVRGMRVEISPAEELKLMRHRAGLKQSEVAEAAGVSRQTISNWENGFGEPSISEYRRIAAACGVTLSPYREATSIRLLSTDQLRFSFPLPPTKIQPELEVATNDVTDSGRRGQGDDRRTSRLVPPTRVAAQLRRRRTHDATQAGTIARLPA